MLDWIIVGGGIHGTHLGAVLRARGTGEDRLRIVDPHPELLSRWTLRAARTGMRHLRSPGVHHVGVGAHDLFRWASKRRWRGLAPFKGRNRRPSLELFQAHARSVIGETGLDRCHETASMTGIEEVRGGLRVLTDRGSLTARRVILAPGGEQAPPPSWAEAAPGVHHLFAPDLDLGSWTRRVRDLEGKPAIIGGGISAVQATLHIAEAVPDRPVILVLRHPLRVHRFDSDPGWLGPRNLRGFQAEPDPARRRTLIAAARNRGSITAEEQSRLRSAVRSGRVELVFGEVERLESAGGGGGATGSRLSVRSCMHPDKGSRAPVGPKAGGVTRQLDVEGVLLATGLNSDGNTHAWIRPIAVKLGLPLGQGGFPEIDRSLSWGDRIFLTGTLADLELGPVAGNIAGARMAARRILARG